MRIAFFSECYLPVANGVVTSIVTLRDALVQKGHQVYVVAPGVAGVCTDPDFYPLPALPFPRHPYHFARPFPRLPAAFERLGVELVHCHHPFTAGRLGAETARRQGAPMVYTAHSLYDTMAGYARLPIARTVGKTAARGVVRRFCKRAACVIVPSAITRDALRADGVQARFAVIPSSAAVPQARPGAREAVRGELGIPPEAPLLLSVGRLAPEKRVDLLLRAVAHLRGLQLPGARSRFRLALVGDGQCRADLEQLAAELGIQDHVHFAGLQPHDRINDWYTAADLFLLACPVETQGLVLVEAMQAGLPSVVVDHGGAREVVVEGETGLRVRFDAHDFAEAVARILCDSALHERMREQATVRARQYTPGGMADAVLHVYRAAISGNWATY